MNIGLNNDEKNWLLTLYSNLKQKGEDDKISTIFTPKQIIEYCYGITKYLALSPLSESQETLSERLRSLWEETGVMVRSILHGCNTGNIIFWKDHDSIEEYFSVDINSGLTTSFSCKEGDSDVCSWRAWGGGFITDSYLGYFDILPLTDWEFELEAASELSSEELDEVSDYIKNHFIILIPKYYHNFNDKYMNNIIKYGFVNDDGSYSNSIYSLGSIPITVPNVFSGTLFCGEFPHNPETLHFRINDSAVVSYDSTKFVPVRQWDQGSGVIEVTKSYTISDRVACSTDMARYNDFDVRRGDYSYFDVLDDIKIQLPEEQADILLNFRNYIN